MGLDLSKHKFLTSEESREVVESCRFGKLNESSFILLAYLTGGRAGELLSLTWDSFSRNEHGSYVLIRASKGGRDREIPIPNYLYERVEQVSEMGFSTTFWGFSYEHVKKFWRNYLPPKSKKTFHSLRHTFAMRLYKKTKDVRLLRYALGHKNITHTMTYIDYVYSVNELQVVFGLTAKPTKAPTSNLFT